METGYPASVKHENHQKNTRRFLIFASVTVLILVAFLLYGLGRAWRSSELVSETTNASRSPLIRSTAELANVSFAHSREGQAVLLHSVRVQSVVGDYIFMIDLGNQETLPVVLQGELTGWQSEEMVQVKEGQDLRIFGFLLPMDDLEAISNPYFIDESERQLLRSKARYIAAFQLTPAH